MNQLGEAEIQNFQPSVRCYHQVTGFQVAVNDALRVRRSEAVGELHPQAHDFCLRKRSIFHLFAQ